MATKGEVTRGKIIEDATRIFHRKGFLTTTISDLLAATGTTKGNLYFHFAGKEAVGLAVLANARAAFRDFLAESLQGETPGAQLDNFFHQALERNRRNQSVGGCLFGNTALEACDNTPSFAQIVGEVFSEWIARLEEVIAAAQAAGQVRRDLAAAQLAELVVATIEGAIMQTRLKQNAEPLGRALDTLRVVLELKL